MIENPFKNTVKTAIDAPDDGEIIVKGVEFSTVCREIWVGTAGDIELVMLSGAILLLKSVPTGFLVCRAIQVNTVSTADDLVALW